MTRTITALLAAATIIGISAPASAQIRYFAREKIVGMTMGLSTPTAPATPSYSCDPFVATTYVFDGYASLGNATSEADAATLCVNFMKTDKRSGYCMWDPRSSSYGVSFHPNAKDVRTESWISHKAAKCTAK